MNACYWRIEIHAGNAESLARRSLERVLDERWRNGLGELGKSVRRSWTPGAALATAATAAHTATLFATVRASRGPIRLAL